MPNNTNRPIAQQIDRINRRRVARTRRPHSGGEQGRRAGGTARPRHPAGARLRVAGQSARLPAADKRLRRSQVDAAVGDQKGEAAQPTDARPFRGERLREWGATVSGMWNFTRLAHSVLCIQYVYLNDFAAYVNLISAAATAARSGIIKLKFK